MSGSGWDCMKPNLYHLVENPNWIEFHFSAKITRDSCLSFFFFCYSVGGGGYLDDVTWQHRFRYLYWAQPLERDGKSVSESEEIGKWKSFSAKCFEWVLRAGSTETDVKRRIFTHSTGDSNSKNHCKILLTFSVGQHVVILKPLLAISATFLALIYFCSVETIAVSVFYKHNK